MRANPAATRLPVRTRLYTFPERCTGFDRIGRIRRPGLAWWLFGRQRVDGAVRQVREALAGWGCSAREPHLTAMVCQMFLLNRSPLLEVINPPGTPARCPVRRNGSSRGHPAPVRS